MLFLIWRSCIVVKLTQSFVSFLSRLPSCQWREPRDNMVVMLELCYTVLAGSSVSQQWYPINFTCKSSNVLGYRRLTLRQIYIRNSPCCVVIGSAYCTVPLTLMYRIRYLPTLPLPGLAELWKTCPPDVREMTMIWQLSKMKFIHFWYSSKR